MTVIFMKNFNANLGEPQVDDLAESRGRGE